MLDEIKLGEKQLEDIKDDVLARELGLGITPSLEVITANFPVHSVGGAQPNKKPRKTSKPGQRSPTRDSVGGIPHAT